MRALEFEAFERLAPDFLVVLNDYEGNKPGLRWGERAATGRVTILLPGELK